MPGRLVKCRRTSMVRRSFVLRAEGVGHKLISGATYKFLGIASRTIITIGSTAVLARLLTPAEFGHIAMATVITEFAALFGAFGFTNVLIQRRVNTRLQLDTVFWATLGLGVLLAGVVFVASFFAGWLFTDALVGPLLRWLSLAFVLNSLSAVPWVVMSRLMRFGTEFWVQTATVAIRTAVAIACAYEGLGVWSLVMGALSGALAGAILEYVCVPFVPRWRFHLPFLIATWRTSGSYFGSTVLYYMHMNLDLLLIGRHLGAAPLGLYQSARSLTDEIRARIAMPIQQVLFPAFSALQTEPARFRQLVLQAGGLLAAVVIPIGIGVSANANELVLVLYGEKWRPMIPLMIMFGLGAALRASTAIASPLFNASDRVGLALRYNFVGTTLSIAGVFFSMPYGVDAVAKTLAVLSLYALVNFRAALALVGLGTSAMVRVLGYPSIAALAMWMAIAALKLTYAETGGHVGVHLALQICLGMTVYIIALHLLSPTYFAQFLQLVRKLRKGS